MSKVRSPRTMTPQSPRRARGSWRASLQAGQSQKNAGTPHPAPVPMNVNVCCVAISLPAFLRVFRTSPLWPVLRVGRGAFAPDYSKRLRARLPARPPPSENPAPCTDCRL